MVSGIGVKNATAGRQATALLRAGKDRQVQRLATSFNLFAGPPSDYGQQFVLTVKPGLYVLACFMNNQDGREHTELGMERMIRVVR